VKESKDNKNKNTMSHHVKSINRQYQHKNNKVKARHQLNNRPGLINNIMFVPTTSLNNCLVNPFYVVNLNCNNVLLDLTNLVTLPINHHKYKANEPLLTLTPFLYFFLSPITTTTRLNATSALAAGLNRVNMDYYYYRYLFMLS
jgi:hypothetical protein